MNFEKPLLPGTLLGPWRVVRLHSTEGIMARIYEVQHTRRKEAAALKLLRVEFADSDIAQHRIEFEAIAGARVQHPNLNPVLDAGHYEGRPFLVSPLLDGQNLTDWLAELGSLPIADALHVAMEVSAGLSALHERAHAIHRDVKPSNIFITYQGEVKLIDLGITKLLERSTQFRTNTGELAGSLLYMAPEHLEDEAIFASDLFALGVVLHEMIAGRHPRADAQSQSASPRALYERLLQHERPLRLCDVVPGCPPSVSDLVAQCLAPSPTDRPESAHLLHTLLANELTRLRLGQNAPGQIFRRPKPKSSTSQPASSLPMVTSTINPEPTVIISSNAGSTRSARSARRRRATLWVSLGVVLLLTAYLLATRASRTRRSAVFDGFAPRRTALVPSRDNLSKQSTLRAMALNLAHDGA